MDLFARTWESLDFGVVLERLSAECRTEMGRVRALMPDFKTTLEEVRVTRTGCTGALESVGPSGAKKVVPTTPFSTAALVFGLRYLVRSLAVLTWRYAVRCSLRSRGGRGVGWCREERRSDSMRTAGTEALSNFEQTGNVRLQWQHGTARCLGLCARTCFDPTRLPCLRGAGMYAAAATRMFVH